MDCMEKLVHRISIDSMGLFKVQNFAFLVKQRYQLVLIQPEFIQYI